MKASDLIVGESYAYNNHPTWQSSGMRVKVLDTDTHYIDWNGSIKAGRPGKYGGNTTGPLVAFERCCILRAQSDEREDRRFATEAEASQYIIDNPVDLAAMAQEDSSNFYSYESARPLACYADDDNEDEVTHYVIAITFWTRQVVNSRSIIAPWADHLVQVEAARKAAAEAAVLRAEREAAAERYRSRACDIVHGFNQNHYEQVSPILVHDSRVSMSFPDLNVLEDFIVWIEERLS